MMSKHFFNIIQCMSQNEIAKKVIILQNHGMYILKVFINNLFQFVDNVFFFQFIILI